MMAVIKYSDAMERLRCGDRIMVTNPNPMKITEKPEYALLGGGTVSASTLASLQADLEPLPDGLLNDGCAQTYRLETDVGLTT